MTNRYLIFFFIHLVYCAGPVPIVYPSLNTIGNTFTNALKGSNYMGSDYLEHSNDVHCFTFAREMPGPDSIKAFNRNGGLLASGDIGTGFLVVHVAVQKDLLRILIMDENTHISLNNIVINPSSPPQYVFSTVYTLTNWPGLPLSARRALNLPDTEYFIVVDIYMIIWKIDIAPAIPTAFSSSPPLNPTNLVLYNLLHFDSNYFLASMDAPTLKLIKKSDITVHSRPISLQVKPFLEFRVFPGGESELGHIELCVVSEVQVRVAVHAVEELLDAHLVVFW